MMSKMIHVAALLLTGIAASCAHAADRSCYPTDIAPPPITQVTIGVIDVTTFREPAAVRDFRATLLKAIATPGQRVVLVSFAGIAAGQSLSREYDATLESPISNEDTIANARIGPFKASQRCVAERFNKHQIGYIAALDRLLKEPASPTLQRSEIVYSIRQVITEFAGDLPVRLLLFSDGWQNSQELTFYSAGKPRRIVADVELKAVQKLGFATLDVKGGPRNLPKALWFGLLASADPNYYSDALQVGEMQKFWRNLLMQWGVREVQIGTTLNNPRL